MKIDNIDFEASYGTFAQLPPSTHPEIAFAGRSNVGKSSLLNKILNRKNIARVSSMPGKTITINFFGGGDFKLVDLPGYGYAKVARDEKKRWAEMMEGYFKSGRDIKLVVQLIDMRRPPTNDDISMMEFLKEMEYEFIVVMTKSDKLNKTQYNDRLEKSKQELSQFGDIKTIPFSSLKGEGVQEIRETLSAILKG